MNGLNGKIKKVKQMVYKRKQKLRKKLNKWSWKTKI